MKKGILILFISILFFSCEEKREISSINPVNWEDRIVKKPVSDSLKNGRSYLSVYSEIYSQTEHRTHDLTSTVSMRNMSSKDSIFINKAEYFNTEGKLIRTYFSHPIYIAPMETVEIVIDETDAEGGTGANFIFDWTTKENSPAPLFEGVMISTSGQQGISFTTQAVRIK
jgi:hypothetical protein